MHYAQIYTSLIGTPLSWMAARMLSESPESVINSEISFKSQIFARLALPNLLESARTIARYVGLSYLRGHKLADKFKYVFSLFCIFGAQMESSLVWTVQDIALAFLTLPNIVALLVLWPKVRAATKDFFTNPKYISYRT